MQQYTCPKCLQGYTNQTSHQHVACGTVEPPSESKPDDEVKTHIQVITELVADKSMEELGSETLNADEITNIPVIVNQPKKRGPKPKVKQ